MFKCDIVIFDLWQYYVCCIRSGVIRCTLFTALYLGRTCQCGLPAVLWSHICIVNQFLAAQPRSTAGPLFLSRCPRGTILLTLYSMVWDWRVSRAGPMFFIGLSCSIPFCLLLFFPFFLSICWYRGAGVVGLIRCRLLSLSLALRTSFNNN